MLLAVLILGQNCRKQLVTDLIAPKANMLACLWSVSQKSKCQYKYKFHILHLGYCY